MGAHPIHALAAACTKVLPDLASSSLFLVAALTSINGGIFAPAPVFVQNAQSGFGDLDLSNMSDLDTQIDVLREDADMEAIPELDDGMTTLEGFEPPAPFICNLPTLLNELEQDLSAASNVSLARWQMAIDEHQIENLPINTLTEKCARYQALLILLDRANLSIEQCEPLESAQRLASLINQVPANQQAQFASMLGELAQKQSAARANGDPLTQLCPDYNNIEALMLDTIEPKG